MKRCVYLGTVRKEMDFGLWSWLTDMRLYGWTCILTHNLLELLLTVMDILVQLLIHGTKDTLIYTDAG